MRILIYLAIAIVAAYLGYKIAEITINNKRIKSSIQPIVEELRIQLQAINTEIDNSTTNEQRAKLEAQKLRIIELLSKFYGYTTDELTKLIATK